MKKPRKLSLVRFAGGRGATGRFPSPFKRGHVYVYLGELANMPGHCVVAEHPSGRVFAGYHTDNFVELKANEV